MHATVLFTIEYPLYVQYNVVANLRPYRKVRLQQQRSTIVRRWAKPIGFSWCQSLGNRNCLTADVEEYFPYTSLRVLKIKIVYNKNKRLFSAGVN